VAPDELLGRLARTMRADIGPGVADTYLRTQAFMAAVVLEKLSAQLRLAPAHAAADRADREQLVADLAAARDCGPLPAGVVAAIDVLSADPSDTRLCRLIEALYADADALGPERFASLLGRARSTLRARLDRQMAYAS
jgi:hypothetical protein